MDEDLKNLLALRICPCFLSLNLPRFFAFPVFEFASLDSQSEISQSSLLIDKGSSRACLSPPAV